MTKSTFVIGFGFVICSVIIYLERPLLETVAWIQTTCDFMVLGFCVLGAVFIVGGLLE